MVIRCNGIEIDRKARTVTHCGERYIFNYSRANVRFRAFLDLVLSGGLSLEQLFDRIYGNDPNGGPESGPHYFLIVLNQWEKKFL